MSKSFHDNNSHHQQHHHHQHHHDHHDHQTIQEAIAAKIAGHQQERQQRKAQYQDRIDSRDANLRNIDEKPEPVRNQINRNQVTPKSRITIRQDIEEDEPHDVPFPLDERFEQDVNPSLQVPENRVKSENFTGRSRSVPPPLDGRSRLGANFNFSASNVHNIIPHGPLNPPQLLVNTVDSQGSFLFQPRQDGEGDCDSLNKSNNNAGGSSNGLGKISQDSMLSGGRSSVIYSKEVFPLPIEIPENVADIQAFRRYLSVRRGAVTSLPISFEKRNQTSPSYESIGGRRAGRASMGLTPSRVQLGHEASKRTASLSHAIMTLALLSASICQLRFLITYSYAHSYPVLNYFLIFTSIILEIAAGIGYVMISRCRYDDDQTELIHNYLIFALFIVAVSNVILAAFAFDGHICSNDYYRKDFTPHYPSRGMIVPSQDPRIGQQSNVGSDREMSNNIKYNALE